MNTNATQAQAIMAGNFINLALFIALLERGDMLGLGAVILSWVIAYVSAILEELRLYMFDSAMNWGWAILAFGGFVGCAGFSLYAMARVFGIT